MLIVFMIDNKEVDDDDGVDDVDVDGDDGGLNDVDCVHD